MDTYSGIIQEMSNTGAQLVQAAHPDSKLIRQRDEMLTRELRALKKETKDSNVTKDTKDKGDTKDSQ